MKYKVLITTSGLGQRLGKITNFTNKSLIKVGKMPAISHIIESYPEKTEFVVTLGHFSKQIKDFISLAYPKIKVDYVQVNPYFGKGSSLAFSILKSKKHLQCPFIFHACDTLVLENIPEPKTNWVGGQNNSKSSQYRTLNVLNGTVSNINEKGSLNYDFAHIGLIGINSYDSFWKSLAQLYKENPEDESLSDCHIINAMIAKGNTLHFKEYKTWLDIGNTEGLMNAKEILKDSIPVLDKIDESVLFFDKFVIKFFFDEKIATQRVKRGKKLKKIVPKIINQFGNFYSYEYVDGDLFSEVVNPKNFLFFLNWCKKTLWKPLGNLSAREFENICEIFYKDKTKQRINKFFKMNSILDKKETINGEKISTINHLLKKIDYKKICKTKQIQYHGDLILDNIIKTKDRFCLLDWRQNFGGSLEGGDIYYDLAKLNHSLTISHDLVDKNLYEIKIDGEEIKCDILCKNNLIESKRVFKKFVDDNNYDKYKINVLTALIWLNMSPLHEYPFNLFLYYFGKYKLSKALENKNPDFLL